ncbi:MAG: hypothetical protein ACTSSO_00225 [Candidatus Hodarchaeales archaeon]
MSSNNPKLAFIRSIAQQSKRLEHEISSETKSVIKNLQGRPKTHYSLQDIEDIVDGIKLKMIGINKEAHTEFSKRGLKDLDSLDLDQTDQSLIPKGEINKLQNELEILREKVSSINNLEMKIDDLNILLEEKETEIDRFKNQNGATSEKFQDQLENLNKLQEQYDEAQREKLQYKTEKEKIEAEYEIIGNTLMTTRLEIEELQTVIGTKDIEIENLNSENRTLSNQSKENIKLKDDKEKLTDMVESLTKKLEEEIDTINNESSMKISNLDQEKASLNTKLRKTNSKLKKLEEKISTLEQENEDLLIDSGETSEEALAVRKRLEEMEELLNKKASETSNFDLRVEQAETQAVNLLKEKTQLLKKLETAEFSLEEVNGNLTVLKQEIEEKSARMNTIQTRFKESKSSEEKIRAESRLLTTQNEDLQVEIKSKDESGKIIETARKKLREELANLKIEFEKQKSTLVDIKTQYKTKDRELTELQKDLMGARSRQEDLNKEVDSSRSKSAEIEREKERYENEIKSLTLRLSESTKENERWNRKVQEYKNEITKNTQEATVFNKQISKLESKSSQLMETVEVLQIYLSKNPKYAILFLLQDIQKASVEELAKTIAIQLVFTERLVKELESEGWIEYNVDKGQVTLKKSFLNVE